MNTPITNRFSAAAINFVRNAKVIHASHAQKLELDRAALMEALEKIANRHVNAGSTGDYREGQLHALAACRDVSIAAIAAARANFPTP